MTEDQRKRFEAYAVLEAHLTVLVSLVRAGHEGEFAAQIDRVEAAAATVLSLPKPQPKAA